MPALPQDPNAPDSPNGHSPNDPNKPTPDDPAQETENESVQAVLFHTSHFKSSDECITWLEENGYASDNLIPGDDAEEPWVAIQFDADECEVDTARREEVENGLELVCCVRKEPEGEEEETPMSGESTEEQPQIASRSTRTPRRKDAEPDVGDPERGMQESVHTEEEPERKPHGAKVLEAMHGQLCSLHDYMTDALEEMEPDIKVRKHVEKMHEQLGQHIGHVEELGAEHYPEHFEVEKHAADGDPDHEDEENEEEQQAEDGERHDNEDDELHDSEHYEREEPEGGEDYQTPQGEEEDEEEDDEKKPKRKPKKAAGKVFRKLARKDLNVVTEAREFLEELSSEDNLKKSQRAACRLHEAALGGVCQKYAGEDVEQKTTEKQVNPAEQEALQAARAKVAKLAEVIYELTGQEI